VVLGALLAIVIGVSVAYRPSLSHGLEEKSLELGTASTTLVVDTERSAVLDLSGDLAPLSERAQTYAAVGESNSVLDALARDIGLPAGTVVSDETLSGDQNADQRSDSIVKEGDVYRVSISRVEDQPLLRVWTQAPTASAAMKLADGSGRALSSYVLRQQKEQNVPAGRRVTIRQIGTAQGGVINSGANLAAAVMGGLVTFVAICLLLLFGDRVRIDLRRMRSGAYSPPPPASRLVEVPGDTRRQRVGAEAWGADLDSDPVGDRPKSGTRA